MSQVHELSDTCRVTYSLNEPPSCSCGWSTILDHQVREVQVMDTEAEASLAELRDSVSDYQSRLEKAIEGLTELRDQASAGEWQRLHGKVEGVRLALTYLRQAGPCV